MGVAQRFWLLVVPALVGVTALGLLLLAFFFPEKLFEVGSTGYLLTAFVALGSLGVVVWQSVAGGGSPVGEYDGQHR